MVNVRSEILPTLAFGVGRRTAPAGPGKCPLLSGPVGVSLLAITLVPIWCCEYFPSNNGPALVAISHVAKHLNNPEFAYNNYYESHPYPIPYLAQHGLTLLMLGRLSPATIIKVITSLAITLRFGAVWFWLRQIALERQILASLVLPLAFDFSVMRGYLNNHMGISLGLVLFAWGLRHRGKLRPLNLLIFNLLALAAYFCHVVPAAIVGILLAVVEVCRARSLSSVLPLVLRGFIPTLVLLAAYLLFTMQHGMWSDNQLIYGSLREKFTAVYARCATPLSTIVAWYSLLLLTLPLVLSLNERATPPEASAHPSSPPHRSFFWVWIVVGLTYMVTPSNLCGWHKADLHMLPLVLLTWLGVTPVPRSLPRRRAFCTIVAAAVIGGIWPQLRALQAASRDVSEFLSGIDAMPRKVAMLSIMGPRSTIASEAKSVFYPLQWADSYYLIERGGGLGRGLMRHNTLYTVWFKDHQYGGKQQFPPVSSEDPSSAELARAAQIYGGVLLWNCSEALEVSLNAHGFQTVHSLGRVRILVPGRGSFESIDSLKRFQP